MSYRTDSRKRSENHDSSSYAKEGSLDEDFEPLQSDDHFLEVEDFEGPDPPGAPWGGVAGRHDAEKSPGEGLPGLSFALSERIGLLQERIDTLRKETAKCKRLHRSVQKAVKAELRELQHLLGEVKVWSLGMSRSVDSGRTNLEREAISHRKGGGEERLRH